MKSIPDVFSAKWENEMSRLANLVGMYTGMRTGEERDVPISEELYNALLAQLEFNPRKDIDGKQAYIFFGDDSSIKKFR